MALAFKLYSTRHRANSVQRAQAVSLIPNPRPRYVLVSCPDPSPEKRKEGLVFCSLVPRQRAPPGEWVGLGTRLGVLSYNSCHMGRGLRRKK